MSKYREIERLRGVAILLAIFNHAPLNAFYYRWFNGVTGVHLFFVISGFVITLSFLRLLDSMPPRAALGTFFVRRFFRIVPMAAAAALLSAAAATWLNSSDIWGSAAGIWHEIALVFTLRYNYAISADTRQLVYFWSLNVEEHFYLVLPFFLVLVRSRRARLASLMALGLAVALIVRPLTAPRLADGPALLASMAYHARTHVRLDALAFGVILGLLRHYRVFARPRATRAFRAGGTALATLAILTLVFFARFLNQNDDNAWIFVDAASVALVWLASQRRGLILNVPFVGGAFEYLGSRSYCIYLMHMGAWKLVEEYRHLHPVFNQYVSASDLCLIDVALVLLASELCHRLIEKPFMKMMPQRSGERGLVMSSISAAPPRG
jgi:peptidoglycan/LPS O-acetylase OafA/YrhL